MQQGRSTKANRSSWVPTEMRGRRATRNGHQRLPKDVARSQWLPDPGRSNGAGTGPTTNGAEPAAAGGEAAKPQRKGKRPRLPKRASARERWLLLRLRRSRRRLRERDQEIDRLKQRLSELEVAAVEHRSEDRPPRSSGRSSSASSKSKPSAAKKRRRPNERLDLNSADFDELRAIGLTVTQSSRLLAYRETNGAFASMGDVQELPGFGKATLALLRSRAQANGSQAT
jgi:DNA uptake protein ComE-like DNA-binding protein